MQIGTSPREKPGCFFCWASREFPEDTDWLCPRHVMKSARFLRFAFDGTGCRQSREVTVCPDTRSGIRCGDLRSHYGAAMLSGCRSEDPKADRRTQCGNPGAGTEHRNEVGSAVPFDEAQAQAFVVRVPNERTSLKQDSHDDAVRLARGAFTASRNLMHRPWSAVWSLLFSYSSV